MKLIVFGSTGTVGKHVVLQALTKGIEVTAFCRDKLKWSHFSHPNLTIVTGDVFDAKSVEQAILGHDAVCIVLGSGKDRKGVVRSVGTKHVIEGMKHAGVDRLICQTTLGAGESKGNLNFFWKRIMFGWFLKQVYLDHELQEEYVRTSNLNWTLVRPGAFTDGELTGQYRHGFAENDRTTKLKIARKDVADFIIKELESGQYLHQAPGLSY